MRIAVTTPNGHVGQHLSRMLIRADPRPLLLTRHPGEIPSDLHDFAERKQMDSRDVESVVVATENVDALYWVTPSRIGRSSRRLRTSCKCTHRSGHPKLHRSGRPEKQCGG